MPKEKKTKKHRDRDVSEERSRSRNRSEKKTSKHKKHRREGRSRSKSRSVSPDNNVKLLQLLEERRLKEREERQRKKAELKAKETPEEKRARRLQEKQQKEVRRRERMGWDTEEYQHYTNQDNPFGDSNLMSTFVWGKKLDKEGLRDVPLATMEVLSRHKQMENKLELEKVKKRRIERELERQSREEEVVLQQRSREAAQFQEWERQEDQFHLEQARLRSIIRIQDGRAKPIDLLAQYISSNKLEDAIEMQVHEPYILLNGLGVKDLEDLLVDIKVYVELDKNGHSEFWDDMTIIVEDELHKLQKLEADGEDNPTVANRREGIHQSVAKDVSEIFRGKSAAQLEELRQRIEQKISIRSDGVDISYWESLLSQLKAHMARARLRDRHEENLRLKLKQLKSTSEDEFIDNEDLFVRPSTSNVSSGIVIEQSAIEATPMETNGDGDADAENVESDGDNDKLPDEVEVSFHLYEKGNYSPHYITPGDIDKSSIVLSAEQDQEHLDAMRAQFLLRMYEENNLSRAERMMRAEARKGMMGDEAEFSVETPLDDLPVQLASDKYRPRKPRYFNRVHTGFEWNKYNQTHYDMDNPPPKIVQGYKFNIFYPDLMDKANTPQYFLTPCADNHDFAILRFHAGPPYEDIAFKIVNREWEFSYKRGFRCQFHNNIFQLWFHFKRYRYRR